MGKEVKQWYEKEERGREIGEEALNSKSCEVATLQVQMRQDQDMTQARHDPTHPRQCMFKIDIGVCTHSSSSKGLH